MSGGDTSASSNNDKPLSPQQNGDLLLKRQQSALFEDLPNPSELNGEPRVSSDGDDDMSGVSSFLSGPSPESPSLASQDIAAKETQQICWLRGLVVIALLLATFMVSVVIFYSTRRSELEQFELQFEEQSLKIMESLEDQIHQAISAIDDLSIAMMSYSKTNPFPFVELPDFAVRAASTRHMASAALLALIPLIRGHQREQWERFSVQHTGWVEDVLKYEVAIQEGAVNLGDQTRRKLQAVKNQTAQELKQPVEATLVDFSNGVASTIYRMEDGQRSVDNSAPQYFPIWQHSPVQRKLINFNIISDIILGGEVELAADTHQIVIGQVSDVVDQDDLYQTQVHMGSSDAKPFSNIYVPIFTDYQKPRDFVGLLVAAVDWTEFMQKTRLSNSAAGMQVVLANQCGQAYTFQIENQQAFYLREGDAHDPRYDHLELTFDIQDAISKGVGVSYSGNVVNDRYCRYTMYVYPTRATKIRYTTNKPKIYTTLVVVVFLFTSLVFATFDWLVQRRQGIILESAVASHRIVAGLFPAVVRNRLLNGSDDNSRRANSTSSLPSNMTFGNKRRIKNFLADEKESNVNSPIADLFPNTTVLFADIAGFTAWSSLREPAQVFTLLEKVYAAFDRMAARRKVFKVETIGDCYVAVTGLPEPQQDHAVLMAKFASECIHQMFVCTRELETELGPDTTDLAVRIGLHSGPVTAGVLRGQKSRFQLFGDTVNTASRMESTGKSNYIQCSQATADLLRDAGKNHWVRAREDLVHAKGKGAVQTFWVVRISTALSVGSGCEASNHSVSAGDSDNDIGCEPSSQVSDLFHLDNATKRQRRQSVAISLHMQRFVDWNVDLLGKLLKSIIAVREAQRRVRRKARLGLGTNGSQGLAPEENDPKRIELGQFPRDEYCEAITLPRFDPKAMVLNVDADSIVLGEAVESQLRNYVSTIARAYRSNSFHNFEHACHVTMAANKILKRVITAEDCEVDTVNSKNLASKLHDFTYGITSDPLTHFACVFSAMVHDVDHPGVSNAQLIKEDDEMAAHYNNKSVAEQNSLDIAWELLMDAPYTDFRNCIFQSLSEATRFRSLLVNSIMATDIFDPELKAMRDRRWNKAFSPNQGDGNDDLSDLKATIVIEHIIQASDVAHTMQHWHVYQKWNQRLFDELYSAFKSERSTVDPSVGWYGGELWFYDNYIIPLAKKLKDCGVFGVASDEFLTYALENRREWESKGREIVSEMMASYQNKNPS